MQHTETQNSHIATRSVRFTEWFIQIAGLLVIGAAPFLFNYPAHSQNIVDDLAACLRVAGVDNGFGATPDISDLQEMSGSVKTMILNRLEILQITKIITLKGLYRPKSPLCQKSILFFYAPTFEPGMQTQIEDLYNKINGQSYWNKILMVIGDAAGVPITDISGFGPGSMKCKSSYIRFDERGAYRGEGGCVAAVYYNNVHLPDNERRLAGNSLTSIAKPAPIDNVEDIIMKRFAQLGGNATVYGRSSFHREISVHGIRNVVLQGENLWEKVNVVVAVSQIEKDMKFKEEHVLLSSDGYFASGMGSEPPIASYTNPMEPKYFKYLDDFTRELGEHVSIALMGK